MEWLDVNAWRAGRSPAVWEGAAEAPPWTRKADARSVAAGLIGGFCLLAVTNAVAIAITVPLPAEGISRRVSHHVFDAAETIGVGVVVAALASAVTRWLPLPRWGLACVALLANLAIVERTCGEYLVRLAWHALGGHFAAPLTVVGFALAAAALTGAPFLGRFLGCRGQSVLVPALVAAGLVLGIQFPFRDDYMGPHGLVAWGAVLLAAPILAPAVERLSTSLARGRAGRAGLAAFALFALFGLIVPPPNATRVELFRQPCAVAPWILASSVWRAPALHRSVEPPRSRWLAERTADPPLAPTTPPLLPADAVVVVVTVDALRADLLDRPEDDTRFATLSRLKREGVVFEHASAPGSQTAVSLSTFFSGRYFSEQRWTEYGRGPVRFKFPAEDPSRRFPELLTESGVRTVHLSSLVFLDGDFGVARGFREERSMGTSSRGASGVSLTDALLALLTPPPPGPLFVYAHLDDAHASYPYGRQGSTPYERYLASVAVADAQLGRILRVLEESFGNRWAFFVSADHGEAFGEHETHEHSKTLYEELLHVPLIAAGPRFARRRVPERVGLVDLGPTVLDLFGVATPAVWNGQSLVPLLAGRSVTLTRPLIAEGRLRRAVTSPEGFKVIEDERRKTVEVYDLRVDPGERRNLFDASPAASDAELSLLRAFFDAHTLRVDGYAPPYKP